MARTAPGAQQRGRGEVPSRVNRSRSRRQHGGKAPRHQAAGGQPRSVMAAKAARKQAPNTGGVKKPHRCTYLYIPISDLLSHVQCLTSAQPLLGIHSQTGPVPLPSGRSDATKRVPTCWSAGHPLLGWYARFAKILIRKVATDFNRLPLKHSRKRRNHILQVYLKMEICVHFMRRGWPSRRKTSSLPGGSEENDPKLQVCVCVYA